MLYGNFPWGNCRRPGREGFKIIDKASLFRIKGAVFNSGDYTENIED